MKSIERVIQRLKQRHSERGSALLVSLMVMVGLSLLGLAFVAVSETENAISLNERNHAQTVAVAEAGAKLVVQWFQNPQTNLSRGLMPANTTAIKANRTIGSYTGYYRPSGLLCDLPFGKDFPNLFCGTEDSPDVVINGTTAATFLSTLNSRLFATLSEGQITDIRLYAPPIVGGNLVDDGSGNMYYTQDGQRFGVATVRVTAQKMVNGGPVAQAVVRLVVGPFPLPGPTGAIQAKGSIANNGNFDVHWGAVESEEAIDLTKSGLDKNSIPWFNAWDIAHIERGYDSSTTWKPSTAYIGNATYPLGQTVRPSSAAPAAAQVHEYVAMNSGTSAAGAGNEPIWPTTPGDTVNDNGILWKERPRTMYQIKDSDTLNYDNHAWLYEVVGRTIEDPWFQMRSWKTVAGGRASGGSTTAPHPYSYAASPVPTAWGGSNWFQYQTFSSRPDYKLVEVPRFDYDFWKSAALAGRGQPGVHYLYASGSNYTDGVTTQSASNWLATGNGFYFIETTNNQNPQGTGATGTLHTGSFDPCGFKGFAFVNYEELKSTGCSGTDGYYPQPGEPYRDVGFRKVAEVTAGANVRGQFAVDAAGVFVVDGAFNGRWDYQDLDWSNSGTDSSTTSTKNQIFDVCVAQRTFKRESDGSNITEWVPIEFYPGCHPGNNSDLPACECSEPHEPYVNIRYSTTTTNIVVGWNAPGTAGRPKKTTPNNLPSDSLVTCSAADVASAAGQANCTSNAWDDQGGLVTLPIGLQGVIYNEGTLSSTGNMDYFGSIVIGQTADPKGTPRVWYDERLVKGGWPPRGINFPRVMITSEQIQ